MRLYSHRALDANTCAATARQNYDLVIARSGEGNQSWWTRRHQKSRDEQARILQDCATLREPQDEVGATLARYGDLQLHPPRCPHRGDASHHRHNLPPAWPADICHLRSDICTGVTIPHMATRDTLPGTGRTKTHYPNSVHGSRLFHRQFLELCLLSPCSVF